MLNDGCAAIRVSIAQYIGGVMYDGIMWRLSRWRNQRAEVCLWRTLSRCLEKLIIEDEVEEEKLGELHESGQKELDGIKTCIAKAKDIAATKKNLKENERVYSVLSHRREFVLSVLVLFLLDN